MDDNKFIIKTAFAMGDPDEKYGQTWYATVEELPVPVMFNLMTGTAQELDRITFEVQEIQKFKTGKNAGKEYRRLKKVRVEEHAPREITQETVAKNETNGNLEARIKRLEDKVFLDAPITDVVHEVGEDTINLSDISF